MTFIRELGDGLVLRRSTSADAERLPAFNARIHNNSEAPDDPVAIWTRDLLTRPHPTFGPGDFTVVQDTRTGRIVSSLNLISQTWSYAGIPFGVGRIELVGTDPDYRRRGLVREQFDVVHRWSADRGELVQGITGISWYYRQFGYEYALTLDGGRGGYPADLLPEPADPASDPFRVRPATLEDILFMGSLEREANTRYLVAAERDEAIWRFELSGRSDGQPDQLRFHVIENQAGQPVGFLAHVASLRGGSLTVRVWELKPGVPWPAVAPSVLRFMRRTGEELVARTTGSFAGFTLTLEDAHPAYMALQSRLPRSIRPYAWYIRVPDLPAFVLRIAPVLESRLAASPAAGYTGELRITFFRNGLRLRFRDGRLESAEPWPRPVFREAGAAFPDLTFLQILFGHRSLDEIYTAFPDCEALTDDAHLLVTTLFPKLPSNVRPVD
jgi:hypothetical protein